MVKFIINKSIRHFFIYIHLFNHHTNGKVFIYFSLRKSNNTRHFWPTLKETKPERMKNQSKKVPHSLILAVYIKKNKKVTKFKIRRGRHLFTYSEPKPEVAKKITDSLDSSNIEKVEIRKRRVVRKAKK